MSLQRKPLVTAHELEALLAKPVPAPFSVDTYFPFRLAILVLFSAIWFVRLTVFTQDVATDLFSNPVVQEFMMPALYFRAWILFVFISAGVWSYKNGKFPAIVFGLLFVLSLFNLLFDISVQVECTLLQDLCALYYSTCVYFTTRPVCGLLQDLSCDPTIWI